MFSEKLIDKIMKFIKFKLIQVFFNGSCSFMLLCHSYKKHIIFFKKKVINSAVKKHVNLGKFSVNKIKFFKNEKSNQF